MAWVNPNSVSALRALSTLRGLRGGTRDSPIMPRDAVSRTTHVGTVGKNGLRFSCAMLRLNSAADFGQRVMNAFRSPRNCPQTENIISVPDMPRLLYSENIYLYFINILAIYIYHKIFI